MKNTSYYYNRQFPMRFFVENGLERLSNRLRKGMILKSRIVYCLGGNRYLLRIFGYNMVMESRVPFNRFDEIYIKVIRVHPRLELRFVSADSNSQRRSGERATDILA